VRRERRGAATVAAAGRPAGLPGTAGGAGPSGSAAPGSLAATPVNGHVTGQVSGSCRQRTAGDGQPLPDPACTPGVVSTAVTQDNLGSTICRPGYTKTIRPPESETEAFKKKIMTAYQEPGSLGDYELDPLVSLELGDSNDAGNLWPEHNDHPSGAINSKDLVENALNKAVCSGKVSTSPPTEQRWKRSNSGPAQLAPPGRLRNWTSDHVRRYTCRLSKRASASSGPDFG
jgi:hypothetical protein